jgi:hypothetical protein
LPQTLATVRFAPPAVALRTLPQRKGLTGAHLLESQPMAARRRLLSRKFAEAIAAPTGCCSSAATMPRP